MVEKIATTSDGPVPADLRALILDPIMWDVGHLATGGLLGVVLVMAAKPSGGVAWLFPVVGALLGIALSHWQLSLARTAGGSGAVTAPAPRSGETAAETVTAD
jgi:hypothetical protein